MRVLISETTSTCLVSAGFDAAVGDPLGECEVTPAGFAHMTQMLTALAGGKVVAMLEVRFQAFQSVKVECLTMCAFEGRL